MKVKDLIKQLQSMDQEAIVDGLYFVEGSPYYYDGLSYDLNRNESTGNKLKMTIGSKNNKVRLWTFGISDFCEFYDCDEAKILENIDFSNLKEDEKERYIKMIKKDIEENKGTK